MFKIGDIVTMSEIGKREHGPGTNNPHDIKGEVTSFMDGGTYCVVVDWVNGGRNLYRIVDLEYYDDTYYFFLTPDKKFSIGEIPFTCFKIINEKECILLTHDPERGFANIEKLYYEKNEKNN